MVTIAKAKADFFVDTEPLICPIKMCELLSSDCMSPYIGDMIEISPSFEIKLKQENKIQIEFCVKCSNTYQELSSQKIKILAQENFEVEFPNSMIIFVGLTSYHPLPTFVTGFSMVSKTDSGKIEFSKSKNRLEINF